MDVNLSKLWEIVEDRVQTQIQLSNQTPTNILSYPMDQLQIQIWKLPDVDTPTLQTGDYAGMGPGTERQEQAAQDLPPNPPPPLADPRGSPPNRILYLTEKYKDMPKSFTSVPSLQTMAGANRAVGMLQLLKAKLSLGVEGRGESTDWNGGKSAVEKAAGREGAPSRQGGCLIAPQFPPGAKNLP